MKKFYLLILMLVACVVDASASKAVPRAFEVTLNDGRRVTVMLRGDEHFSYYVTANGEHVLRDKNVWRMMTEKENQNMRKAYDVMRARRAASVSKEERAFPHIGTPKALVIMVSYSNNEFTYGKDDIDKWLNSKEYTTLEQDKFSSYGSVAQFFSDNSNGKYRPVFDVVGPYKMTKTMEYYGENNAVGDIPSRYYELIEEACAAAVKDNVDFSQYDADNDGYVDLVYIFYAGYGENFGGVPSGAIWPKSGYASLGTFGGKKIYRFGMSNELLGYPELAQNMGWEKPKLSGIGVFVHEMCHTLGMPDVYPTENWSDVTKYDNQSMEEWDIMDGGENNYNGLYPTPFTAWEQEWMGWIDEMETITEPGTYTLKPLKDGGKAYRVKNPNDATGNEFYILENVPSNVQGWYRLMPGRGMLVTHINYDTYYFSNFEQPNNVAGSPRWTVIPANGMLYSAYRRMEPTSSEYYMTSDEIKENRAGNTFPGIGGVTALTDWREYYPAMDYVLNNISQAADGTITFDFGTATGIDGVMADKQGGEDMRIYMPDGRYAGNSIDALPSGLYIMNGKKIVK